MIDFQAARDTFRKLGASTQTLADDLELILSAANGNGINGYVVRDAIDRLEAFLFTAPIGRLATPNGFYTENPIGVAISIARKHIMGGDWITVSEGVQILFGEAIQAGLITYEAARIRLVRMGERQEIKVLAAPDEPNPRRRTRYSRQELEVFAQSAKHKEALAKLQTV